MNKTKTIPLMLFVLILSGCKQTDLKELKEEITKSKTTTLGFVPSPPEIQEFKTYEYTSTGLKSPFRNSISELKTEKKTLTEIKPDLKRKRTELEQNPLENYIMLGSIISENDNELQAIMNNGRGKVYMVNIGDYIGKNNGVVIEINETSLKIEEIIPNGSYRWVKRPATITMTNKNRG